MSELGLKEHVLIYAALGFAIQHAEKTDKPRMVHQELHRVRNLVERHVEKLQRKQARRKSDER